MRRTTRTIGAAAIVLTTVATMATMAVMTAQATPRSSAGGTIHVVLNGESHSTFFDFEHDGLGFGDRLVARSPLTNEGGRRVGTGYLDCLIVTEVQQGGKYWCRYVLNLRSGQITTEGLDPQGISDTFFSVTGGTGEYIAAGGQAEFVDGPTQTDIYISLVPTA
jgi:hypothetical protein